MAIRIYNNIPALTSQRYLSQTNSDMTKNLERLSSGLRINSAADDASGLAISEKLRGQISGLQRASMNAQDGISLLQTAEGGLSVITDMVQRMRELAVQAGNGVYTSNDRGEIQKEVDQLKDEINRVAAATEFNTKKLLNGDSAALWSTDKEALLNATVTGPVTEGNYNLEISTETVGTNYVYKTDVMSLNADAIGAEIYTAGGTANSSNVTLVTSPTSIAATGDDYYQVEIGSGVEASDVGTIAGTYAQEGSSFTSNIASASGTTVAGTTAGFKGGYMEVSFTETITSTAVDSETFDVKVRFIDATTGVAGSWGTVADGATMGASGQLTIVTGAQSAVGGSTVNLTFTSSIGDAGKIQDGDKTLVAVSKASTADAASSGGGSIQITEGPTGQDGPTIIYTATHSLTSKDNSDSVVDYNNVTVYHATLDETTGNLNVGSLTFNFKETSTNSGATTLDSRFDVKVAGGGEAATSTTELKDISRFTTSDGRNIFYQTQELTIYGNGTSTSIYLEGSDTLADFETKLSNAIVDDLGMGATSDTSTAVANVNNNLVNYVSAETDNTNEAVQGTFVIQTSLLGENSQLSFTGDQSLIDGLSLATIQEGTNSELKATVTDAHTCESIGTDTFNDYTLRNMIGGLEVGIASDTALTITWDDTNKELDYSAGSNEDVKLHVVDNAMEIQIGANEGQTILTAIPQIDTKALGIDDIMLVDQELAQSAITQLDSALADISSTRSTIGAQINRLEYTITGLDIAKENLTASESRIRDLDFASEMTEYTRNQILNQAGVAMLSQANQLPQLALQLLA
ncbi:MAG: flagellin [Denitrovibrio sp.]|nr:MAG: flagellin [Denitrovibrio sp.]